MTKPRQPDYRLGETVVFSKRRKQYKGFIRKVYLYIYEIEIPGGYLVRMPKAKVTNSQLQINLFE